MLHIFNKTKITDTLGRLKAKTKPTFGTMTPQHAVEHLAESLRFSNGKLPQKNYYPGKEEKIKSFLISTEKEIPIGLKSPLLPIEKLANLKHPNLTAAIEDLKLELKNFENYFVENPTAKPVHPAMGELTHKEWLQFHNNHFRHHLKQFSLLA